MTGIDIGDQTVRAPRPCDAFLLEHHGLAAADVDVLAGHATTCLDVECRAAMTSTLVMVVRQSQSASTAWERVLRSRLLTEMRLTAAVARILAATTGRRTVPRADLEQAHRRIVHEGLDWEGPQ